MSYGPPISGKNTLTPDYHEVVWWRFTMETVRKVDSLWGQCI